MRRARQWEDVDVAFQHDHADTKAAEERCQARVDRPEAYHYDVDAGLCHPLLATRLYQRPAPQLCGDDEASWRTVTHVLMDVLTAPST